MKSSYRVIAIVVLVVNFLNAQSLEDIPNQFTSTTYYDTLDLSNYITGSNCYQFNFTPSGIGASGLPGHPNLLDIEYQDTRENMTVTMKINYAGFNLGYHPDDAIWVYDDQDNLVEVNNSYVDPFLPGEHIFYLNVRGNFDNYLTKVVFYSGVLETTFEYEDLFEYGHNRILGTVIDPFVIDEAPLYFSYNSIDNTITAEIIDDNYSGDLCLDAVALDCDGEEIGTDQFCYGLCDDHLTVSQDHITTESMQLFSAGISITSDVIISAGKNITFSAADSILLLPGFEVKQGSQFSTNNIGCQ